MEQLPSNSHRQRQEPAKEPKKIEKVVQGEVIVRKKPLFRRMSETFFAGRADTVSEFVLWDVLVPAAKNTVADAATSFVDRMMFGDGGGRGRASAFRPGGGFGGGGGVGSYGNERVAYNRPGQPGFTPPGISHRGRARHDFKEVVIPTRVEAEEVLDNLFRRIAEYNAVTVADLYELCNITPNWTDDKFGWTNIEGAGILLVRGGFVLDLPRPEPLD